MIFVVEESLWRWGSLSQCFDNLHILANVLLDTCSWVVFIRWTIVDFCPSAIVRLCMTITRMWIDCSSPLCAGVPWERCISTFYPPNPGLLFALGSSVNRRRLSVGHIRHHHSTSHHCCSKAVGLTVSHGGHTSHGAYQGLSGATRTSSSPNLGPLTYPTMGVIFVPWLKNFTL